MFVFSKTLHLIFVNLNLSILHKRYSNVTMDNLLTIYQLNAQSADRIDERRDTTTRLYGGMCIFLSAAAMGTFENVPLVSVMLWVLLSVVAIGWLAMLDSLKAKLQAKNELLTKMESDQEIPFQFLTNERRIWETFQTKPLQFALKHAPTSFLVFGLGGMVGTLVLLLVSFSQSL